MDDQLIMLDSRGMGHSTANKNGLQLSVVRRDVIGLLDALGVK